MEGDIELLVARAAMVAAMLFPCIRCPVGGPSSPFTASLSGAADEPWQQQLQCCAVRVLNLAAAVRRLLLIIIPALRTIPATVVLGASAVRVLHLAAAVRRSSCTLPPRCTLRPRCTLPPRCAAELHLAVRVLHLAAAVRRSPAPRRATLSRHLRSGTAPCPPHCLLC